MNGPESNRLSLVNRDYRFKLVIMGGYGVGKTSLMLQHFDRRFSEEPQTTVGVDFRQRKFHINDASVILEVWDTAGEEKYSNIVQVYYRGAHSVVAVYDITNKKTYERALKFLAEVLNQAIPPQVIALVGNKCDLEQSREVPVEDAEEFASKNSVIYIETSAKTSHNVDYLFEAIATQLVEDVRAKKSLRIEQRQSRMIKLQNQNRNKLKCCK